MSRIGRKPIAVPAGVKVQLAPGSVDVQGPKGKMSVNLPRGITLEQKGPELHAIRQNDDQAALHGLARALVANAVTGVTTGFKKEMDIVGVGYRAEVKGTNLNLSLGFSHPIAFPLPKGVKCEIPGDSKGTILILTGSDKEVMGQTAAKIRGFRPPEPYGGKGVRYQGEKVREKAGKAAKAGGK